MKTVHVMIHGRVQGVWFRATTKKHATKLGLVGWVRNTDDGRVEAVFQGENAVVDEMIEWCHQGSPLSRVEYVDTKDIDVDESLTDFIVRY
jgi:acylphosphatase